MSAGKLITLISNHRYKEAINLIKEKRENIDWANEELANFLCDQSPPVFYLYKLSCSDLAYASREAALVIKLAQELTSLIDANIPSEENITQETPTIGKKKKAENTPIQPTKSSDHSAIKQPHKKQRIGIYLLSPQTKVSDCDLSFALNSGRPRRNSDGSIRELKEASLSR